MLCEASFGLGLESRGRAVCGQPSGSSGFEQHFVITKFLYECWNMYTSLAKGCSRYYYRCRYYSTTGGQSGGSSEW
jgi:hypothetical protein